MNKHQIRDIVKQHFCDKDLYESLKGLDAVIAGGAITSVVTGKKINDFDIYFNDLTKAKQAVDMLTNNSKYKCVSVTDNATTFVMVDNLRKFTVQLITSPDMIHETYSGLYNSFDFTINMAVLCMRTDEMYMHDKFLEHNMKRILEFNEDTLYPIISLHRAVKYMNRGYTLSGYEQVKIALAINNLHMRNYRDLKVQLQGIDTSNFKPITDKLMEDPDMEYEYKTIMETIKGGIELDNDSGTDDGSPF